MVKNKTTNVIGVIKHVSHLILLRNMLKQFMEDKKIMNVGSTMENQSHRQLVKETHPNCSQRSERLQM